MASLFKQRTHFLDGHAMTLAAYEAALGQLRSPTSQTPKLVRALAQFQQVSYVGLTGSGRAALWCLLKGLALPDRTPVLMPAFTCVAVFNAVVAAGYQPVFYDIETETYGPDAQDLSEKLRLNPHTRVVIVHHLFGLVSTGYEECVQLAKAAGCLVIEDVSQSFGARYKGQRIGRLGHAAFTSFEQSKQLSTYRGGAYFTNDVVLAQAAQAACQTLPPINSDYAQSFLSRWLAYYRMQRQSKTVISYSIRAVLLQRRFPTLPETAIAGQEGLTIAHGFSTFADCMAPVALAQLQYLDVVAQFKRAYWPQIVYVAASVNATLPRIIEHSEPAWLRVPLLTDDLKKTTHRLTSMGHQVGYWFHTPVHPSSIRVNGCPRAEAVAGRLVNIGFPWPCLE